MSTYLAFDLGAESGRAMLGTREAEGLRIEELHRFPNAMVSLNGHLHWNSVQLFQEVKAGLRACAAKGATPVSAALDTWGVDFGLLDRDGELLGLPYCYRDPRTTGLVEAFDPLVARERVYELTGIQFMAINTLYQLYSMVRSGSPALRVARHLLMMPDLLHYFLTGRITAEFTIASTSQLYNPRAARWEPELIAALDLPQELFPEIVPPTTPLGALLPDVAQEVGIQLPVVAAATHDTGSAVAAVPAQGKDWAYISSGTWSLLGIESDTPLISPQAQALNFTNEGGVGGTFRVLKNIMGLWLVQRCRRVWDPEGRTSYADLTAAAETAKPFETLIYPDAPEFLNPPDMVAAISEFCMRTGQRPPATSAAFVRCILESLALRYRAVLEELRQLSTQPINRLHIIGGGTQNRLLCQFAADATGIPVLAGPVEATAIGNLLTQALASGEIASVAELRQVVADSFPVTSYQPQGDPAWELAYTRFRELAP